MKIKGIINEGKNGTRHYETRDNQNTKKQFYKNKKRSEASAAAKELRNAANTICKAFSRDKSSRGATVEPNDYIMGFLYYLAKNCCKTLSKNFTIGIKKISSKQKIKKFIPNKGFEVLKNLVLIFCLVSLLWGSTSLLFYQEINILVVILIMGYLSQNYFKR